MVVPAFTVPGSPCSRDTPELATRFHRSDRRRTKAPSIEEGAFDMPIRRLRQSGTSSPHPCII
jgi:hypothetical protein